MSSVWKADVDDLMKEAWKAMRKEAGSPISSQSLAGMIAHVTEATFNACPLEHLETCPLGQEVSACELFGRLSQLFKKTYGIGLDFTRSLDSLTEQIHELQIKQQQIHDRDLCAIWPKIRAALPPTATSAPPPAATANEVRAWMMDPANALYLASITSLNINGLHLKTVPSEIGQLSQLAELYLFNNQITSVPDEIGQLPTLEFLNLSDNQITSIPVALAQLSQLSQLYLDCNKITNIPDALAQLPTLEFLNLSDNQITSIPDAIGQLSTLEYLNLSDNQITSIPDAIGQLLTLACLRLSGNKITTIPDALAQLAQLKDLFLYNNQITSIPDALAQLSQLAILNLDGNQITSIPDAIAQFPKLAYLTLESNQITNIPDAIAQLPTLEFLDLRSNPIFRISKAVLTNARTKDNATIKIFAKALQWQAKSPLAKLCLAIMQDRDGAMQNMPALLSHLSSEERGRIFYHVWDLNKCPQTPDAQWGEHHALDNPELFMRAVHRSIVGHLQTLPPEQKNAVYRKLDQFLSLYDSEELQWGKNLATENAPRLADALAER
jgi:Leucine-rich repeat (LRR) protein